MMTIRKIFPFALLILSLLPGFAQDLAHPIVDDFEDGDLGGWEHYAGGDGSTWLNVDGVFELFGAVGTPFRTIYSLQESQFFDDFVIKVDVLPLPQIVDGKLGEVADWPGLLARASKPVDNISSGGYLMSVRRRGSILQLWSYTNGQANLLTEAIFDIPFDRPLRFVFKGKGPDLTAQLFDDEALVGELNAVDNTYTSGFAGVTSLLPAGQTASFDNFKVYHPVNPPKSDLPNPIVDDFDDGDLGGWEHYTEGTDSTCRIVDGALELSDVLGSRSRVTYTLNETEVYDDFVVEADVLPQLVDGEPGDLASHPGLLARVSKPVNNISSGYFMNIRRSRSEFELWKFTDGRIALLNRTVFDIPFDRPLHFVFKGVGTTLTAQVFDSDTLVAEISAHDATYTSGFSGLTHFWPAGETGRFDNFKAYHPEIPPLPEGEDPDSPIIRVQGNELGRLATVPQIEEKTLAISNDGKGHALEITSATVAGPQASHFSVAPEQLPLSIPPGETIDLEVTFDSRGRTGEFQASLTLATNDFDQQEDGEVVVNMTARIINTLGPEAHYPLDDSDLSFMSDITGFDRSGSFSNDVELGAEGIASGSSIRVHGGASAMVSGEAFDEGTFDECSFSLWFQGDSMTEMGALVAFGDLGSSPAFALMVADGNLSWFAGEKVDLATVNAGIEASTPYHAVVTYSANGLTIYVNGMPLEVNDSPEKLDIDLESTLHIGRFGLFGFNGRIDDVQIYNRVLVPSEVQFLHDNPGEPIRSTAPEDSDGDGLTDEEEVNLHHTDPLLADTDGDQRTDGEEVRGEPMTDPLNVDTDGDGFDDGFEVCQDADPNDPNSLPADVLGKPDHFWQEFAVLDTFNGFDSNADGKDVTFRAFIDFEDYQSSENDREIIWETGAGTVGFSLVYESGNRLVLRAAGNAGLSVATVKHALTQSQIEAGELSVIWTFDIDNGQSPESQTIALYLDEALVGDASANLGPDWSGSNAAAFGVFGSIFAAGGNNTALDNGVDFQSATINLETGLQMYVDRMFEARPQPESANVEIREIVRTETAIQVTLAGSEGSTVDLEYSPTLIPGSWEVVMSKIVLGATSIVVEDLDDARRNQLEGYYRLRR